MRRQLLLAFVGAGFVAGCNDPDPPRPAAISGNGQIKVNAPGVDVDIKTKGNKTVEVDVNHKD